MSERGSLWNRLYNGETNFEFIRRWRIWFLLSTVVILAGVAGLLGFGLNRGIDFKGGSVWEVKAPGVSVAKARDTVRPFGLAGSPVQTVGGDTIRVKGDIEERDKLDKVTAALAKMANTDVKNVNVNFVGPSWGKDVSKKAQNALIVFFILITAYIALRFEWKMAIAALAAVFHDVLITVGVYSLSRFEVTPATVIAFLTILGYSLYDTIVVFDKVEENVKSYAGSGKMTYTDIVNLSMNQVLMRSLNTSLVALLPILSLLVFGAGVMGATALGDFGLALFIGLLTGAYSSIFIASPVLALLKEREPRYRQIRERIGRAAAGLTPAAAAAARGAVGSIAADGGGLQVPRPRKQGKKR